MSLDEVLLTISTLLAELGVPHRLIGAAALAAHGVARSTQDIDLLAADDRVLDPAVWSGVSLPGFTIDVRRGDRTDPVAGVVRIEEELDDDADWDQLPIDLDLVVLAGSWVPAVVASSGPEVRIGAVSVMAVDAAGLVLLKLYAGGPRDAWDISTLLQTRSDADALIGQVEARIHALPTACATLWARLRDEFRSR